MKKYLIAALVLVLVLTGFKFLSKPNTATISDKDADMILFWGNGCPHCETVKNYIKDNKVEDKLKISYKEVYYDKSNQALLESTAVKCQMDTSKGLGVPFAYIDGKCLVGDQPIIDAVSQKIADKK